jgi:hypothetical protein
MEKIHISSEGKGATTEVLSIELYGIDEKTEENRYEKIIP